MGYVAVDQAVYLFAGADGSNDFKITGCLESLYQFPALCCLIHVIYTHI
ncbi:hypothetical protein SDC9_154532 [bioreactor metagenome]|uniref:Uncharacterized protein n=1 Tax=bioreactor metagenome TaxID=1076179 RepID=A0A645F0Q9_9ZZZZ